MLSKLELDIDLFAKCYESDEVTGNLTSKAAKKLGLTTDCVVVGGAGDCAANGVGTGVVKKGVLSTSIGTSGVMFVHSDEVEIDPDTLFDVQIKRIHEYKRQFMNVLYVIHRYLEIKAMTPEERSKVVARTVMIAGKAAPGYDNAKKIIKLINEVSYVINNDEVSKNLLKILFIPNYNVSAA